MTAETNISNLSNDSGGGRIVITEKGEMLSRKFFLKGKTIGISISHSDNLTELGYGVSHLNDAMIEIARYIIGTGGKLAYGGDMRQGGFTELIFDLLAYYKADKELLPNERFYSYLSYPISTQLTDDKQAKLIQNVSFKKVAPPSDIELVDPNDLFDKLTPQNLYIWSRCLTQMREEMDISCNARIFIGGAIKKFKGKCPGTLEELLIAIENKHPVYLVGAFGGITREVIEILKGNHSEAFTDELYCENVDYKRMLSFYNEKHPDNPIDYKNYMSKLKAIGFKGISERNGLCESDNLRLATTPHIHEAIYLILKGLTSRFTN
jgi:hypothetical protein